MADHMLAMIFVCMVSPRAIENKKYRIHVCEFILLSSLMDVALTIAWLAI